MHTCLAMVGGVGMKEVGGVKFQFSVMCTCLTMVGGVGMKGGGVS